MKISRVFATLVSVIPAFSSAVNLLKGPLPSQIKNLITFGDSYTDVVVTGDNGTSWPTYAAGYGHFDLFPFARAGATCDNNLTFRPFPPVFGSQIPLFLQEFSNGTLKQLRERMQETIFTLWIGTNDVGVNSLITGSQTPGVTVVNTTSCAINFIRTMYHEVGARNFLFQNMIPLEHTILYSDVTHPNRYWTAPHNATEWSIFMKELTSTSNEIAQLMLAALPSELPGAHIGLFDSHGLFTDMLAHPQNYLNGTAPLNTTGAINDCIFQLDEDTSGPGLCTVAEGSDRDSFLWYDELHPSEQSDRVVARQVTNTILRISDRWTTWFS